MFQTLSKKLKNRKGFTLIELIVVLAILGIILAIAVPNYLGVQAKAADDADQRSAQLVEKATEIWYLQEGVNATFTIVITENTTAGNAATITWNVEGTAFTPASTVTVVNDTQSAALTNYIDSTIGFQGSNSILYVDVTAATSGGNPPTITATFTNPNAAES